MKAKLIILTLAAMGGAAMMVPSKESAQLSPDPNISVSVLAPAEPTMLETSATNWLPVDFGSGRSERERYRSDISDNEAISIALSGGSVVTDARGPGVRIPGLKGTASNVSLSTKSDQRVTTSVQTEETKISSKVPEITPLIEKPAAEPNLWRVNASRVNLRSGPSTKDEIVGVADSGETLTPMSPMGSDWVEVMRENGERAWIFSKFLEPSQG